MIAKSIPLRKSKFTFSRIELTKSEPAEAYEAELNQGFTGGAE